MVVITHDINLLLKTNVHLRVLFIIWSPSNYDNTGIIWLCLVMYTWSVVMHVSPASRDHTFDHRSVCQRTFCDV